MADTRRSTKGPVTWAGLDPELRASTDFRFLKEDTDLFAIADNIGSGCRSIRRVILGRGKSVTKVDKKDLLQLADGIDAAVALIKMRLQKEADESRANVSAGGPDLDSTIVLADVSNVIREEMGRSVESIGKLDLKHIESMFRKELDSFKSEVQAEVRTSVRDAVDTALKDKIPQGPLPNKRSYAAATSTTATGPVPPNQTPKGPVSRPALILQASCTEGQSSSDVIGTWRKSISFKDSSFGPAKVQPLGKGKVRVEFNEVQQRDEVLKRIEEVPSLKAGPAKRSNPLVILKGINKSIEQDEVVDLLIKQNPSIGSDPSVLKKRFTRKNKKDDLYDVVLEVQSSTRRKLLDLQRLNMDHQRVRVLDFSTFIQCYKCLGFGHVRSKCPSETQACSHCASTDHPFSLCPDLKVPEKLKCHNCCQTGRKKDLQHSATSRTSCPLIKSILKKIEAKTDYS